MPRLVIVSRLLAVAAVGLPSAACTNPFAEDAPTLNDILSGGWLFPSGESKSAPVAESPLYCYSTIGTEDCYMEPLPDQGGRLVGFQGPPPPPRDDI